MVGRVVSPVALQTDTTSMYSSGRLAITLYVSSSVCLSVRQVCLSVWLSVCMSVLSVPSCLSVCVSVCMFVLYVCLSVCRSVRRPVYISVEQSVLLSERRPVSQDVHEVRSHNGRNYSQRKQIQLYLISCFFGSNQVTVAYVWSITRKKRNALIKAINGNTVTLSINGQTFEVLNVSATGNCFYDAMQVALAFHNEFVSSTDIKQRMMQRMLDLEKHKSLWFKTLYESNVDIDQRTKRPITFRKYMRELGKPRVWAHYLEVMMCAETFHIEIQTNLRGKPGFTNNLQKINDLVQHSVQSRYSVQLCHLQAGNINATTGHNHYVFLRPVGKKLTIHDLQDKDNALLQIHMLMGWRSLLSHLIYKKN